MDLELARDFVRKHHRAVLTTYYPDGRAQVSPGWQSRIAHLASALAPELMAAMTTAAATRILPGPATAPDRHDARWSRDLDLGPLAAIFPTRAAVLFNQPAARGELAS